MSTSSFGSAFSTGSAGSGGSSDSLSYGQPQSLTGEQKLQAARNAGTLVTLSYELVPQGSGIPDLGMVLPRLPCAFMVDHVSVTTYDFYHDPSDSMSFSLSLSAASGETIVNDSNGFSEGTIIFAPLSPVIPARQLLTLNSILSNTGIYGSYAYGLVLWIRGVWLA